MSINIHFGKQKLQHRSQAHNMSVLTYQNQNNLIKFELHN
jgi:hypothetical protein